MRQSCKSGRRSSEKYVRFYMGLGSRKMLILDGRGDSCGFAMT